jgi:acyl-CoA thioesterase YciA
MPADTNPNGDIFGGWLLSQMDIAGGIASGKIAQGRTVTVAIDSMNFHLPVHVGDVICCYVDEIKRGRTSMTLKIEAWTLTGFQTKRVLVTEGIFTYVAIDQNRKPRVLPKK